MAYKIMSLIFEVMFSVKYTALEYHYGVKNKHLYWNVNQSDTL